MFFGLFYYLLSAVCVKVSPGRACENQNICAHVHDGEVMLYLMNKRSSLLHENIMALLHGSFQCIINPSRLLLLSLLPSASLLPYLGFYLKGARMAGFSYIPNWLSVFMCGQLFQLIGTATDRCPLLKDGKASQRGAA